MDQQPNKKRTSDRQLTKDDLEEDEEQASDTGGGTWQPASDDVLSKRRIVKARRPAAGRVARLFDRN